MTEETSPGRGVGFIIASWVFITMGVIAILVGYFKMTGDIGYDEKLVGGDAYNYIVFATRGAEIIGIGGALCMIGVAMAVMAVWAQRNPPVTVEPSKNLPSYGRLTEP
jgi:hypothetical protein